MEKTLCTAVFWRGGEKIDLKGLKPNEVRCLTVSGEKITDLAFLSEYPNLEMLTLDGKFSGVETLSNLEQLNELSLWLSEPVNWENVHLSALRSLHLRGEKNGDVSFLLSNITFLHLQEMRTIQDLSSFLCATLHLEKLFLESLASLQSLPELQDLSNLHALKLYELHKLNDLSALSRSHLHYFAASLIADKMSAGALAKAVLAISNLKGAALQLVDRSERRYSAIQKVFASDGKSDLLREEISNYSTWISLG